MNKLILFFAFIALGFLTVMGSVNPDLSAIWLSSQDQQMDYLRIGAMVMVISLLMTTPPRNLILRFLVGWGSVVLIATSVYATYHNIFEVLDGIALLIAGIASLIAALEFSVADDPLAGTNKEKPTKLKYSTTNA